MDSCRRGRGGGTDHTSVLVSHWLGTFIVLDQPVRAQLA